ncbi:MAG: aminotransferase [Flavobacteriales bacterium]|nr:MAG: aminotransferase [Flavobacteriales bacterium]
MAENLIGSEIIKLADEIKVRSNAGEQIYNFTIGDFDPNIFPIPEELKEEIIKAYNDNRTDYPTANGLLETRQAISRFLHTRGSIEYNENQILVSCGARPLIYATYQAVLDPGDSVIFPVPSWNNNHYTHLSRGKAVFIETSPENNFMPTADEIKPRISEANLIAACSPLNPTGTTFGRKQLSDICELILDENRKRGEYKKPVYLLYDQIYWQLTYGSTVHFDPVTLHPEMKNYTIYVDGMSKAFASTGLRVGWGFGPQKIINKMKSIISHIGAWAPKAEQVAVANYLQRDADVDRYLNNIKNELGKRLSAFYEGFKTLKEEGFGVDAITPQAAMYLTIQFNLHGQKTPSGERLSNTEEVTRYILNEAKIALVPFYAFGSSKTSNWYRLSVGTASMKDVEGFFVNLRSALERLS